MKRKTNVCMHAWVCWNSKFRRANMMLPIYSYNLKFKAFYMYYNLNKSRLSTKQKKRKETVYEIFALNAYANSDD